MLCSRGYKKALRTITKLKIKKFKIYLLLHIFKNRFDQPYILSFFNCFFFTLFTVDMNF